VDAPVRWGLVGASDIAATRVVPAMRAVGHAVTGVCSGSADRAAGYAREHEIPLATDDLDRLLGADVDAVYISSRNGEHAAQAQAAAAAGKHVLCEKPLATTLADAQKTVDACAAAGVVLAVNHHLPGAGTHRRVRELVAAGAIGRPLGAAIRHAVLLPERLRGWRLSDEPGAGVILDITVHDASVLNPLFGVPALEVTALAVRQGEWDAGSEDAAMVGIRYAGEVLAQTHDSFTSAYTPTRLEVHGDAGSIVAHGVMTQDAVGQIFVTDSAGEREIEVTDRRDLYEIALTAFADAVRGSGCPTVTGAEGLAAYAVAEAALESSRSGRAVPVHQLSS
jgi:1,5-anhydro-D-fructose reductase (1,5-anhydro-D-mannitol-forming)